MSHEPELPFRDRALLRSLQANLPPQQVRDAKAAEAKLRQLQVRQRNSAILLLKKCRRWVDNGRMPGCPSTESAVLSSLSRCRALR